MTEFQFMVITSLHFRVPLANGGYLVIEQTEALVSIDVNGGHCMLGEGTSQQKVILDVNLTAAKQVLEIQNLYYLFLFVCLLFLYFRKECCTHFSFSSFSFLAHLYDVHPTMLSS